jgi:hypothetical protein
MSFRYFYQRLVSISHTPKYFCLSSLLIKTMLMKEWRKLSILSVLLRLRKCRLLLTYMQSADILWHVDPFLSNDREISNYTTAVAK